MIQNPGFLSDHTQNWITGSLCHAWHILKISERSVHNFSSYLADSQTARQTNKQTKTGKNNTSLAEVKVTYRPIAQEGRFTTKAQSYLLWGECQKNLPFVHVAVRQAALVSDESALEACLRRYKLTTFTFTFFALTASPNYWQVDHKKEAKLVDGLTSVV